MTNQEIINKYLALVEEGKKEYKERQKDENTNKIVEAIRTATKGEFICGPYTTTLMGHIDQYDEQGRILTADPNYKDSSINICGEVYPLTRVGWWAYVWLPQSNARYTSCWSNFRDKRLLAEVDLRPDYVKEYEEKIKKSNNEKIEYKYVVSELETGKKFINKIEYIDGEKNSTTIIDIPFDY